MNLSAFRDSLKQPNPPTAIAGAVARLWWDARGDWTRAHESAQEDGSSAGAWVHAYLHRKEGDASDAAYWYQRAGKSVARGSFEEEWIQIATALLEGPDLST